jgi:hypothetical protein
VFSNVDKEPAMTTRTTRILRCSFLAAALSVLLAAGPNGPGDIVTIDLPGVTDIEGYGIDDHGNVTGLYYDADGNAHGFVYSNGEVVTVDGPTSHPALSQTNLYNITSKEGRVGAYYLNDDGQPRAAVFDLETDTWSTLPAIPGATINAAGGVNLWGLVVGNWTTDPTGSTGQQGWIYHPRTGNYTFFDVPVSDKVNNYGTIVNDINIAGVVVGWYADANGGEHGFTKVGARYRTIDIPGALNTELFGINSHGDLAGRYRVGDTRHGFVLRKTGELITFDAPGAINTWVEAVSDNGNIAGLYQSADGNYHAFYQLGAVR